MERGSIRVKYLAQECNAVSSPELEGRLRDQDSALKITICSLCRVSISQEMVGEKKILQGRGKLIYF